PALADRRPADLAGDRGGRRPQRRRPGRHRRGRAAHAGAVRPPRPDQHPAQHPGEVAMSLRERVLAGVNAGELLLGLALVAWRATQPRPPGADLATLDPITAGQLDDLARRCRTTEDWVRLGDAYIGYGFFRESEACCRQVAAWEPHNAEYAY